MAKTRRRILDKKSVGIHFNLFGYDADGQMNGNKSSLIYFQSETFLHEFLEALGFRLQTVVPDRKLEEDEVALRVACDRSREIRL